MKHCERAPIDWDAQSNGTRRPADGMQSHVPTTINVYLFLEFTIITQCTNAPMNKLFSRIVFHLAVSIEA